MTTDCPINTTTTDCPTNTTTTDCPASTTTTDCPTVVDARAAQIILESAIQALVAEYEDRYDVSVQDIRLTHRLAMGHPRRVMRVLATVHL